MEKIKRVWFDSDSILMESTEGRSYSRKLADFPTLFCASEEQRMDFTIVFGGEAIRWEKIDEDIHISSFYETKEERNEIASIFYDFPMLNISEVAQYIGINESLLANYIYGRKKPSAKRINEIKEALRTIGRRLAAV